MMSHFSAVPNNADQSYSNSCLPTAPRLLEGAHVRSSILGGLRFCLLISQITLRPLFMKRRICLTEPRALLPRGGTGRGHGHRRRCPLLTLLPCCLPIEVWAIQTDARAPGGQTDRQTRRADDLEIKKSRPTIGRTERCTTDSNAKRRRRATREGDRRRPSRT